MRKFKALVGTIIIITLLFTGGIGASAQSYGSYYESVLNFMQGMYYKGLTDEEALKAALKGLFSGLDKYSGFYDREETEALNNSLMGSFVGIGAGLQENDKGIEVVKVYDNSPAERAGLQEGDIITAVDGVNVVNKDVNQVASVIRGEKGTTVRLTILRDGVIRDFSIVRDTVVINPVIHRIEGDIAYIMIDSFTEGTSSRFADAMDEINEKNILKIILDLRGNPGGYVDEAVGVARKLVPPGPITTLDFKSSEMTDREYNSYAKNPKYVIAVLVDENSASASEILAGALQDAGNGILIGKNTYGKGVFQNMFSILTPEAYEKYSKLYGANYVTDIHWMSYFGVIPTKDEIIGTVKLTTGHYLTRNGRAIDGVGLQPSVVEENPLYPNGVELALVSPLSGTEQLTLDSYSQAVNDAENILKAAGYFSGSTDKRYDSQTFEAVKKYQTDKKLPVTGIIDAGTMEQLNGTLYNLRKTNDKQYDKACVMLGWL